MIASISNQRTVNFMVHKSRTRFFAFSTVLILCVSLTSCASETQTDGKPCDVPGSRGISITGKDIQCYHVGNIESKWAGRVFGVSCSDQSEPPTMDCTRETHLEWRYTGVYFVSKPPYELEK
jgi:hypothetical protein